MSEHFDLVIAGGSFAGLASARTAALRGLKVAVLDPKLEPGARPPTTGIVVNEACDEFDLPAHLMRKVRGVRLYAPEAFFKRLFHGYGRSAAFRKRHREREVRHKRANFRQHIKAAHASFVMFWRLSRAIAQERLLGTLGRAYLKAYIAYNKPFANDAMPLQEFLALCARHWHHFKIAADNRSYWGRAGVRAPEIRPSLSAALARDRLAS